MRFRTESRQSNGFLKRPLFSFSSFLLATVVGLVSSFTFSAAYDLARTMLSTDSQTISGVWCGQWHGVPAVAIRLKQDGSLLSGTVRFSTVAASPDGPKVVAETGEIPLVNPKFDGKRLCFQIQVEPHLYPVIVAEMELNFINADEAELRRTGDLPEGAPEDKEVMIRMKRERSF